MRADAVDLPMRAATCYPLELVSDCMRSRLLNIESIFPDKPVGVGEHRIGRSDRDEYAKLVRRMLQIQKVKLVLKPRGVGSFFVVPKTKPGHLRPIWHGGVISDECLAPPPPRRLGNPASFVDVCVLGGRPLLMSKRDAASYFDVLKAPCEALTWFCCPPLRARTIAGALGVTLSELGKFAHDFEGSELSGNELLYPATCVWPMGFSWSSSVAQDTTIGLLTSTGLAEVNIICDSEELPADDSELVVVATDDCISFMLTQGRPAVCWLSSMPLASLQASLKHQRKTSTSLMRSRLWAVDYLRSLRLRAQMSTNVGD